MQDYDMSLVITEIQMHVYTIGFESNQNAELPFTAFHKISRTATHSEVFGRQATSDSQ